MTDWAIDGTMGAQDAIDFKLYNAKAERNYQILKSEHKSYYIARNLERKTVANVGWLHKLAGVRLNNAL